MMRRCSARIASKEKKKIKRHVAALSDSVAGRLGYVLELGSVEAFLSSLEISNLIQVCSGALSVEFVAALSLRALDQFAAENETHLGHQCVCNWMRTLDFRMCGSENCIRLGSFTVNRSIRILQKPSGAPALLNALTLAKTMLLPYCVDNRRGEKMFVPVVCLLTENGDGLCNDSAVKKAMNRVCKRAGDRFFYNFTAKPGYKKADFIYEHWSSIEGSTCQHCNNLSNRQNEIPNRVKWRPTAVQRIRDNCANMYRPLKTAMEKELRLVRFIPRPHGRLSKYEGLVAGISSEGVFYGLYLVNGFWPYDYYN